MKHIIRRAPKRSAVLAASRHLQRHCSSQAKIIWTHTDEAPMLASYALLPVIQRFAKPAGIMIETSDISVSGRILAAFPELLTKEQQHDDALGGLGELAKTAAANIVKLPNVSASIPQLNAAIAELQSQGYAVPDFPANPTTAAEKEIAAKYAKVLGSAVNPVLREGNSDRRVAAPVKAYAQKNPHKLGSWSDGSSSKVAHMTGGDFFDSEQSATMDKATTVRIEHVGTDGSVKVMKDSTALLEGEVIDAAFMSVSKLRSFFEEELQKAKKQDLMVSLHLKATMMKISDPIMFGHAVTVFFKDAFAKHADLLKKAGANPNDGLGAVLGAIEKLPEAEKSVVEADFNACFDSRPGLAMVDSSKGITNLHVPSDVIIDASMPVVVRDSGKMWNKDDALEDVLCIIPDRSYATMYSAIMEDCKVNGQFNVSTMGNVCNVGLMAQKAEEYGSHDKTFEVAAPGTMRVVDNGSGAEIFSHTVEAGDIWRMCQTKDEPIKDWVRLAVSRARATGDPATFWLDADRAHDASLIAKVNKYMPEFDTTGLDISIAKPVDAITSAINEARAGRNSISVTGNVLRDYLTDLFPIIELGTSAKMLSIVPLLAGGGLFETGAGGSAPKHVQQFVKEGHLRWDSLGEYLALGVSLEHLGENYSNPRAKLLAQTLNEATGKVLDNNKSPERRVMKPDNRYTTFYIALYWAEAMAKHDEAFKELASQLSANEEKICKELIDCQGTPQDIGGYYKPNVEKVQAAMCPSPTLNAILNA
jgi:isocitrate dehydrogenase